jgi:hypothetical protein
MSDNQENKLPDATENQSTDQDESVELNEKVQAKDVDKDNKPAQTSDPEPVEVTEELVEAKEVNDEVKESDNQKLEKKEEKQSVDSSQDAVNEIEKQVALDSEETHITKEVPVAEYEALDIEGVVITIDKLIEENPIQSIKRHIDTLKIVFNKKFGELLKLAKEKFIKEGGEPIDFHYENPVQNAYNKSLFEYKKRSKTYYQELERQHEENLLKKNRVIDELKELIDNGEANSMYKNFKNIQENWREIGPVSRAHYSDLWRTYHFHVERFYDLLHLRNDLRDLDFKHNLDEKLKLIVRAEALAENDDIKIAFDGLQELHRLWKEEIGPVAREHREEVWNRFSAATKKIHDRRHEYFGELMETYKENYAAKMEVIAAIEIYDASNNKTHKDWQKSIKEINALREQFFAIGKVPRNKNKEVWNRFKEVTKDFNTQKNDYYKTIKQEQNINLALKIKLVEQAEALRESEDWSASTEILKRIQSEWKTIGFVPRKHSDKIWNRFKEACNYYFDRLHNKQDAFDEEKMEIFNNKKEYLEELTTASKEEDFKPDITQLKKYISEWRQIGSVPISKRSVDTKFNKFLDTYFDKLSLNKKESTMLRYRNLIDNLLEQKDYRKIQNEVQFVRKKLDEVTKEKQQLENNMLFFSNADDSNPMIKNIKKTINKHADEIEIWKSKLQYLRSIDV